MNNVTLTTAGFTALDAADNYATPITKTLQVQVNLSAIELENPDLIQTITEVLLTPAEVARDGETRAHGTAAAAPRRKARARKARA